MKYEILDDEVQKTYYYAKKILDSQGFSQKLSIYLTLGWGNQPKEWRDLSSRAFFGRRIIIFLLIAGIILIFTRYILFGVAVIILGLLIGVFWGGKIKKHLLGPSIINAVDSASQKIGSHKLMKIIADEMSKESSTEVIVEALKKEIEDTIDAVKKMYERYK